MAGFQSHIKIMRKIRLLDCTLRDGGYINDWNWGYGCAKSIIKSLTKANVDIVEVGFLRDVPEYIPDITVANTISELNKLVPDTCQGTIYSAMVMQSNYTHKKLEKYSGHGIKMIRLTFHDYDIDDGLRFAEEVKEKGYMLAINPINIMGYQDMDILKLVEKINLIKPDFFSIVDTFGSMRSEDLNRLLSLLDHNLSAHIGIALHLHENMSLSFSLAQAFLQKNIKRDVIVDGSLIGMGRNPGNLPLELIADYLNNNYDRAYDLDCILDAAQEYIIPLKGDTEWGYSPGFFLSAKYNLHRNYAEFYLGKGDLSNRDINHILARIESTKTTVFDRSYAEELYQAYKCVGVDDEQDVLKLKSELQNRKILVLAPGTSLIRHTDSILSFIRKYDPIIISLNFSPEEYKVDYVFVSNNKRYSFMDKLDCGYIVTSNIQTSFGNRIYKIDYKKFSQPVSGGYNSLLMLLSLLCYIEMEEVFLAGADGFDPAGGNYYSSALKEFGRRDERFNMDIANAMEKMGIKIHFLTPSHYQR